MLVILFTVPAIGKTYNSNVKWFKQNSCSVTASIREVASNNENIPIRFVSAHQTAQHN